MSSEKKPLNCQTQISQLISSGLEQAAKEKSVWLRPENNKNSTVFIFLMRLLGFSIQSVGLRHIYIYKDYSRTKSAAARNKASRFIEFTVHTSRSNLVPLSKMRSHRSARGRWQRMSSLNSSIAWLMLGRRLGSISVIFSTSGLRKARFSYSLCRGN